MSTEKRLYPPILEGIPAEMQQYNQWVLWRAESRRGKRTKIPCDSAGEQVSITDPLNFMSFQEVRDAYDPKNFSGIGFVFNDSDPFVGIDLDNVHDMDNRTLSPLATEIVDLMNSYTEFSVSGTGVHVIVKVLDKGALKGRSRDGNVECYWRDRYFCMSGHGSGEIAERQETVQEFLKKYLPEKGASAPAANKHVTRVLSDDEIRTKMLSSKKADTYRIFLQSGDYASLDYPSHSEADMAFCMDLAFWTRSDSESMDRIFRSSAMYRDKWDERHGADGRTYGEITIGNAIANTHDWYEPQSKRKKKSKDGEETDTKTAERVEKLRKQIEDQGDPLSELAGAQRLKRIAADQIRHAVGLGWMHWDGTYWSRSEKPVWRCAHKLGELVRQEVLRMEDAGEEELKAFFAYARHLESAAGIRSVLAMAQTLDGLDGNSIEWDSHPWLLNVPNGTLDLTTGELRQPSQEDYLTRMCPIEYMPDAQCPRWEQFLLEVFCDDKELVDYWQWVVGYSLTGGTMYDIFFVLWGEGANGKTTLLRTLQSVLGEDYAQQINPQALMVQRNTQHPTDIAQLRGARMVVAMETAEGNRLDAALVKSLTGGDKIRARFMRQDTFEFTPELKLFMGTNHRPVIKDDSNGMWRRIRLIPFEATFSGDKRDVKLLDKLNAEMPGILAWAVEGAKRVAGGEPTPPARVKAAVDEYRDDQDTVARFIEELCECTPDAVVSKGALYKAYREWSNNRCESQKKFSKRMHSRGFGETRLSRQPTRRTWNFRYNAPVTPSRSEPGRDYEATQRCTTLPANAL